MNKILIANRGEIAVRIIRACKEMNIKTVAVYSEADKEALHTKLADEAICIGPANPKQSYLNIKNIIEAANITKTDSIHPGFGFLSENAEFAKICEESNIKFIGPKSNVINLLGNKSNSKKLMQQEGVPTIPGSDGSVKNLKEAVLVCEKIGYPVLLKASAGGGGRGMRKCFKEEDFENAYLTAKAEAKACFGDDDMYMEKLILNPKHIEFQILADHFGNVIHLGERDCSIQRRNQKMMEESPSKALSQELREKMGNDAIKAAKKVGYVNAGTIEFVLAPDGKYYFIEMNTRIQVEHPVTEMVTGVDLVREQIRIAAHLKLNYKQSDIELKGHALECRINAENPQEGFRPSPGIVSSLHIPGGFGVRIDTTLYQGYQVSSHYDSMIAKVIVHGRNRIEAIRKMRRVLSELVIDGIDTNQELQYLILHESDYVKGNFDTSFIEKHLDELVNER
ncbi:MAG: acetyl-CoA carboxylase biotin carboxylase subunit [Erysipelotrichaceae bacterium]|nr:acetyl-CoA carboxylase biotin carboxylase subunit [Erysipelotrichaceae bacterium]